MTAYVYDDFFVDFFRTSSGYSVKLSNKYIDLDSYHFVYVLFKDKSKMFEVRWVKDQQMNFDEYGDGIYYVQIEYRKIGTKESKFVRTKTIASISDSYKETLEDKLNQSRDINCKLEFMPSEEPFFDFLITNDSSFKLDGFKKLDTGINGYFLYANGGFDSFSGFLLSGFCVTNSGKYRVGSDFLDLDFNTSNLETENAVGTYTKIIKRDDALEVCSDYHSSSKLYHFSRNGRFLISNRYHLAMIYLKTRDDIESLFNKKKAIAMLSTGYHELFSHNFNSETLIKNLFQLYIGQKLTIKEDSLRVSKSEVFDVINDSDLYDVDADDYEKLVEISAGEIKQNVNAVLTSEKFSDVVVDVSGGIDSRTVFCGVTNFPECKEKISVRIFKSKFDYDHLVANTINDLYRFRFHIARNGWERTFYEPSQYISYIMEAKYFMPSEARVSAPSTILLNGFYGEPSLRPRGAASFLFGASYEHENISIESFINNMVSFKSSPVMIVDYDKAGHLLKEVYEEELKRTPGDSIAIKLENHYMNFSHAYHASEALRPGQDVASFSPIKSKTLFKLYRSVFHKFKSRKLAFDIIYKLNPLVSIVQYEDKGYNDEYSNKKRDLLVSKDSIFKNAAIESTQEVSEWEESLKELALNFKSTNRMPPRIEYETCLALMKELDEKAPDFIAPIKYELLHFIEGFKDNYIEINTIKNKIYSIFISMGV